MIDDEEMGLKVAEDSEEKFWIETKEKCEEGIKSAKRNLKINEELLKLAKKELREFS